MYMLERIIPTVDGALAIYIVGNNNISSPNMVWCSLFFEKRRGVECDTGG